VATPRPTAPRIDPSYGVVTDASGAELLPWSWAVEQLTDSRNYWVSTTRPDGRPHGSPVWGVWLDDGVWICIGRNSVKARNIARNPAVSTGPGRARCDRVRALPGDGIDVDRARLPANAHPLGLHLRSGGVREPRL
jgi:hypothetical protein